MRLKPAAQGCPGKGSSGLESARGGNDALRPCFAAWTRPCGVMWAHPGGAICAGSCRGQSDPARFRAATVFPGCLAFQSTRMAARKSRPAIGSCRPSAVRSRMSPRHPRRFSGKGKRALLPKDLPHSARQDSRFHIRRQRRRCEAGAKVAGFSRSCPLHEAVPEAVGASGRSGVSSMATAQGPRRRQSRRKRPSGQRRCGLRRGLRPDGIGPMPFPASLRAGKTVVTVERRGAKQGSERDRPRCGRQDRASCQPRVVERSRQDHLSAIEVGSGRIPV